MYADEHNIPAIISKLPVNVESESIKQHFMRLFLAKCSSFTRDTD